MKDRIATIAAVLAIAAIFAGCIMQIAGCGKPANASVGTVGQTLHEPFVVRYADGTVRNNCNPSRFTAKVYRNGVLANVTCYFRSYTTAGGYSYYRTPQMVSHTRHFISYSGTPVWDCVQDVFAHNDDSNSTDILICQARTNNLPVNHNTSSIVARRASQDSVDAGFTAGAKQTNLLLVPTNPMLTTDSRLPVTDNISSIVARRASQYSVDAGFTAGAKDSTVAKEATVGANTWSYGGDRTLSNYSGFDAQLSVAHGTGRWDATGEVSVIGMPGTGSPGMIAQGKDVHITRGDSAAIPYNFDMDISDWSVWFGAKIKPTDTTYAISKRDITADVTDVLTGAGLVNLSTADTAITAKRYYAEIEIRKAGAVNTKLRFYLWIDQDVVR